MLTIDLTRTRLWKRKSWDWFVDHVGYLLYTDTAIGRRFNSEPSAAPTEAPDV